jgi:hypothetical protein
MINIAEIKDVVLINYNLIFTKYIVVEDWKEFSEDLASFRNS